MKLDIAGFHLIPARPSFRPPPLCRRGKAIRCVTFRTARRLQRRPAAGCWRAMAIWRCRWIPRCANGRPGRLDRAQSASRDCGRGLLDAVPRCWGVCGRDVAFVVATGLDYLRVMTAAGLDVETAAQQITFSMALGCRFYLAIAKIRALRQLWANVIEAMRRRCGCTEDASACVHRPSCADHPQSVAQHLTQHGRLLRRRGGRVDIITTTPFDAPPACRARPAGATRAIHSRSCERMPSRTGR